MNTFMIVSLSSVMHSRVGFEILLGHVTGTNQDNLFCYTHANIVIAFQGINPLAVLCSYGIKNDK